jgi:hypothetical protein
MSIGHPTMQNNIMTAPITNAGPILKFYFCPTFFFLKNAGELHFISLRGRKNNTKTQPKEKTK